MFKYLSVWALKKIKKMQNPLRPVKKNAEHVKKNTEPVKKCGTCSNVQKKYLI